MKVLHVYRTYFPESQGGLEETIRQICISTNALGVETRILAPIKSNAAKIVKFDGSRVYQPKANFEIASCTFSLEMLHFFPRLANWSDVIHYHFPWPFADVAHFLAAPSKPTVLTYHSDIVRQKLLSTLYRPLMLKFLGSMDQIVCTSPNYFVTSDVLEKFEDKVSIIPFGLDKSTYPEPDQKSKDIVKSQFGENFFLFVGVLRYYKGLHILLKAMQNAPYKVVIAGSGPTERALKTQAEELNLTNVVFAGFVSDQIKVALINASRAIVFPSYLRAEAFGITLLEGAMYGKPLISTEVGSGTSHVNVDRETGLVVPPGSYKALRNAMDQIYRNPEAAKIMGANAQQRYKRHFSSELMGMKYMEVYRSAIESRRTDLSGLIAASNRPV